MCRATIVPSAGQQLQLGDEEQIDERLARRAHELEGRLAKFGTAGIKKPRDASVHTTPRSADQPLAASCALALGACASPSS